MNDRWDGCNCEQCAKDRAAVARVLGLGRVERPSQDAETPNWTFREGDVKE